MVFYHLRQRSCALKQLRLMPRWKTLSRVGMLIATAAIGALLAFIPTFVRSQPQLLVSNSTPAIAVNSLASTPSLLPSPKLTALHIADSSSKRLIEAKARIQEAKSFSEGLALVRIGDKYGFIDKSGNLVIKPVKSEPKSIEAHYRFEFKDGIVKFTTQLDEADGIGFGFGERKIFGLRPYFTINIID